MTESLFFSIFLIFSGAAVVASFALYTRQPLIIAYILLGIGFGPHGLNLVTDKDTLEDVGHIGIVFLLFLLGLDLQPRNFVQLLSKTAFTAIASALLIGVMGFGIAYAFEFPLGESIIVGIAITFSSTIIGLKLLPTTVLHHKHVGELLIGILLIQDILAITVLIALNGWTTPDEGPHWSLTLLALPLLIALAAAMVRWIILPLLAKFDRFHEYIFLLAIGWCLGVAELAKHFNLSLEIGAFIAGISLAHSPIAQYIATHLKPLRDFFLILFFFTVGAGFNIALLSQILVPALLMSAGILILKPIIYRVLLGISKEPSKTAWEVGIRLGQSSEFSLLIAYIGVSLHLIGETASMLIQAAAIISFLLSTYWVVFFYPSPIAVSDRLRRD